MGSRRPAGPHPASFRPARAGGDPGTAPARVSIRAMPGAKTEVRRITQIDEMPQDNEWVARERAWREQNGQL